MNSGFFPLVCFQTKFATNHHGEAQVEGDPPEVLLTTGITMVIRGENGFTHSITALENWFIAECTTIKEMREPKKKYLVIQWNLTVKRDGDP